MLYLIEILHQTTTCGKCEACLRRCILSKFYIKPQLCASCFCSSCVVSYRNSTSNHNLSTMTATRTIVVSYRNSTSNHNSETDSELGENVVSYRNSTSNHNSLRLLGRFALLYLIEILHQTTTSVSVRKRLKSLYLIEILHQTTTTGDS